MTPRQDEAFRFMAKYEEERGYPPTILEIGTHLFQRSKGRTFDMLQRMVEEGVLEHKPGRVRGYKVRRIPELKGTCPACGRCG